MDGAIESAQRSVTKAEKELKTVEIQERATHVLLSIAEDPSRLTISRVEAAKVLLTITDIRMAGGFGR